MAALGTDEPAGLAVGSCGPVSLPHPPPPTRCLSLPGCGLWVNLRLLPLKVISNSQEPFRGSVFYLETHSKAWCEYLLTFIFTFIGVLGCFSNARSPFLPGSLSFLPSCSPQTHPAAPCPAPPWVPAAWHPRPPKRPPVPSPLCLCPGTPAPHHCCYLVTKFCPTVCDPMDCSPPGSAVRGILQAIILEWIVVSSCRGSSQTRDRTYVSGLVGEFCNL